MSSTMMTPMSAGDGDGDKGMGDGVRSLSTLIAAKVVVVVVMIGTIPASGGLPFPAEIAA